MREILAEGDLLVAEVHAINADKSCNLHTRNKKYGRLEEGLLVSVPSQLIKRQKYHFLSIDTVGVILGVNGNIFLSATKRIGNEIINAPLEAAILTQISRLSCILTILKKNGLQISELLLKELLGQTLVAKDLEKELYKQVLERVPTRIAELSKTTKSF